MSIFLFCVHGPKNASKIRVALAHLSCDSTCAFHHLPTNKGHDLDSYIYVVSK